MKQLLFIFIILLCPLLTFAQFSGTVSDSQGVKYTANNDESTCYVSGCEFNYSATITIPKVYEGRTVTSIGSQAFEYCSGLNSVTISNSVTSISDLAFHRCSGLTSVTIPNSVTSIGEGAYDGCSGLTSMTIPNSVTSIGRGAFEGCSGLTSVTIPNSVTFIGGRAFCACSGLTSVTIPNNVTFIGGRAFDACSGLTSIIVENGNSKYDSRNNCNAIIETGTNTLHTGCKNTVIPNSVTSIGSAAFWGCSSLTSVNIPNCVTSIGDNAFRDCSGLTSVDIPNSVTSIGHDAFEDCRALSSVTIGNSVASIGAWAFSGCSGLISVIIPNSVTSIDNVAFKGCSGLTSIIVENGNPNYDSRDNCNAIIETATNILLYGCMNTIIPNSVTSISNYAFYDCSSLTSVIIPNSVTSIGNHAFDRCSGLTSVTIPNSVKTIGRCAFYKCSGLTSMTIGNSVTSIGDHAFQRCSGLTSVAIPNSVTSIDLGAFSGCSGLTSVTVYAKTPISIDDDCFSNRANATLYVPEGCKEAYQAAEYWNEFKEIIERGLPAVDGDEDVDFGDEIDDDTNLDGNIVGNIYYVISSGDGSYNAGEGCIVVTKPTDDTAIDGQDIFGEDFKDNYTGIVFKVPAGKGTVTVEAKTEGNMVLKVKIGDAAPISMELEGRLKVTVPYDVTEPTNVYIYGGSKPAAAPATRRAATESGELKLYGFTVTSSATGIKDASRDNTITDSRYYTLDGRALDGIPAKKGVYIVNGRSVVVK